MEWKKHCMIDISYLKRWGRCELYEDKRVD